MTTMVASRLPSLFDEVGGEPTLDELLAGVWEELAAHRVVTCPVCQDPMTPQYGVHSRPIGGRCKSCGSTLS
ncbi:MAG: hypothetical protein QOD66_2784 [Solirubrobacteraceae bacterium]|jgi:hypothetical protein|nr:hypothetical protein [Solirubrobacteraceae bacterium]